MRELIIERIKKMADGDKEIEDSYGDSHSVADLDLASDEDLLTLYTDMVGFNG